MAMPDDFINILAKRGISTRAFLEAMKQWMLATNDPRLIVDGNRNEITDITQAAIDFCRAMEDESARAGKSANN